MDELSHSPDVIHSVNVVCILTKFVHPRIIRNQSCVFDRCNRLITIVWFWRSCLVDSMEMIVLLETIVSMITSAHDDTSTLRACVTLVTIRSWWSNCFAIVSVHLLSFALKEHVVMKLPGGRGAVRAWARGECDEISTYYSHTVDHWYVSSM